MLEMKFTEYLLAILESGSFSRAASNMYISQPALSQTIRKLEQTLGTPVLNRNTTPISLTYAGKIYIQAMQQVEAINTNLSNELNEIRNETRGTLRLGVSLQRGMQLLPLVVPQFSIHYPQVEIDLTERGSTTLEKFLQEGKCDIALITTEPHFSDLHYELLETEEVVLVAAKDSPLGKKFQEGEEVPITVTEGERFISLRQGHSVRRVQDQLFLCYRYHPPILLETDSLEAAKRLVAAGAALMLCPNVYIDQSPEVRQHVKCFRIENIDYQRHFFFCYRKDMALTRFMRDFLDIIRSTLRTN